MATDADILVQADWEIIGFFTSAYIGIIINILCLVHLIKSSHRQTKIKPFMKYYSITIIASSLLYCVMVGLFRTNIIFNNFDFNQDGIACHLTFGFTYFFYVIVKFSVYMLFAYRLEVVFLDSPYAISKITLNTIRIINFLSATVCGVGVCIFLPKKEIITPQLGISLCTGNVQFEMRYGDLSIVIFVLMDLIISGTLLYLFCYNLYKMSKLVRNVEDKAQRFRALRNIQIQLMKATILVSSAVLSAWIFIFIGNFVWWGLGWFIPIDITINSLTIYLMFGFNGKVYQKICIICIACCKLCISDIDDKIANHAELQNIKLASVASNSPYPSRDSTVTTSKEENE